ncbi:MAG: HlyC/CorC family transporter [Bacteroidetes bacterium]|nr:MAG: HlyC/CorC family transporter [Bacteroidota bacterium]
MLSGGIAILLLMLLLSFFFSGMEIAFLSANRLKIELKTAQGSRAGRILSEFKKRIPEVLITILIGNNIALVLFTTQFEALSLPLLENELGIQSEGLQTLILTLCAAVIVLIFAEYIPKAIFRTNSDRIVFPLAYVLNVFYYLLYLPMQAINLVSKLILKYIFRVKTEEKIVAIGQKDLDLYIQEVIESTDEQSLPELDTAMLNNALAFRQTKARECMIPRTEIVAASIDTPIPEIMDLFIETRLSKIIIYQESLDQVEGFVHSNGMFRKPGSIREILQPVLVVPESMPANMLLAEFTENKSTVAIVVDEFGGTSGMITIEDLVEEVFGEIEDEYDKLPLEEDTLIIKQEDGSYLLGARCEIDDLNEELGLSLPEEEYYTTLGGLITYHAENIPAKGESIVIGPYLITVVKATKTRILTVKLQLKPDFDIK